MPSLVSLSVPYGSRAVLSSNREYLIRTELGVELPAHISDCGLRINVNVGGGCVNIVRVGSLGRLLGDFWNVEFRQNGDRLLAIQMSGLGSLSLLFGEESEVLRSWGLLGKYEYCSARTHFCYNCLGSAARLEYADTIGGLHALLYFVYMLDYHHFRMTGRGD